MSFLRHKDQRALPGRTPYELWRDNRPAFETYQSYQLTKHRSKFCRAPYWASFVATPDGATKFVSVYAATYKGLMAEDIPQPHTDKIDLAGSLDAYDLQLDQRMADLESRVFIDWGTGKRAWVQRADKQNKPITEIHTRLDSQRS
jgi:hypothetical protein